MGPPVSIGLLSRAGKQMSDLYQKFGLSGRKRLRLKGHLSRERLLAVGQGTKMGEQTSVCRTTVMPQIKCPRPRIKRSCSTQHATKPEMIRHLNLWMPMVKALTHPNNKQKRREPLFGSLIYKAATFSQYCENPARSSRGFESG